MANKANERYSHFKYISDKYLPGGAGISDNPDAKYLDFGGNDGVITTGLADLMNLDQSNIILADINESPPDGYETRYIKIDENSGLINLPDSSIDVISCLMVLHHVKNLEDTLTEFYRILKPEGRILVREHDATDKKTIDYLRGIHKQWGEEDLFENYQSRNSLKKLFESKNFHPVGFSYYPKGIRNYQKIYHVIYMKL